MVTAWSYIYDSEYVVRINKLMSIMKRSPSITPSIGGSLCAMMLAFCGHGQAYQNCLIDYWLPADPGQLHAAHLLPNGDGMIFLGTIGDAKILRFNGDGSLHWSKVLTMDTTMVQTLVYTIGSDSAGNSVLALDAFLIEDPLAQTEEYGFHLAMVDPAGDLLWSRSYTLEPGPLYSWPYEPTMTIQEYGDGFLVNFIPNTTNQNQFCWTMYINDMGIPEWSIKTDLTNFSYLTFVDEIFDDNNSIYQLFYQSSSSTSSFMTGHLVQKINSDGSFSWGRRIKLNNSIWTYDDASMTVSINNSIIILGTTYDNMGALNFLAEFDTSGSLLEHRSYVYDGFSFWPFEPPVRQLPDGSLVTGIIHQDVLSPTREHVSSTLWQVAEPGDGQQYGFSPRVPSSANDSALFGFRWTRTDPVFSYTQYTAGTMKLPMDLQGACGFISTALPLANDSLTPSNVLEVTATPSPTTVIVNSQPVPYFIVDADPTNTLPFCTLLAIEDQAAGPADLLLAPNPVLAGQQLLVNAEQANTLLVHDALGRLEKRMASSGNGTFLLETSGLPPGVHVLHAVDGQGKLLRTGRLVVQ